MNISSKRKNKRFYQEQKKSKADRMLEMYQLLFNTPSSDHLNIGKTPNPVKPKGWIAMTRDEWKRLAQKIAEKAGDLGIVAAIGTGKPGIAAIGVLFHSALWGLIDIRNDRLSTKDIEALAEPGNVFIEELKNEFKTQVNIQEDTIDLLQKKSQEAFRRTASAIKKLEIQLQDLEMAMKELKFSSIPNLSQDQIETLVTLANHLHASSKDSAVPQTKALDAFIDEQEIFDILNSAEEAEIDTIMFRLKVPKSFKPGDSAPLGKKVLFLIDYSKGLHGPGLASLLWAYSEGRRKS